MIRHQLLTSETWVQNQGRPCASCSYSCRDQTVRFAHVTILRVEGKNTILCNPKTLPTQELRQRATKYCRWEIMFVVWTVYASLSATPPKPSEPLVLCFWRTWNAQIRAGYCKRVTLIGFLWVGCFDVPSVITSLQSHAVCATRPTHQNASSIWPALDRTDSKQVHEVWWESTEPELRGDAPEMLLHVQTCLLCVPLF
jgi:hypothetical protein